MTGAFIQARLGSARLPGKVLRSVQGKPMLQFLVDGLSHATALDAVVVATSVDRCDDPIAAYCASAAIPCYRGPLDDVAARMLEAATYFEIDAVVRISGDSPLLDHRLVDQAARRYRETECDLVTNIFHRSFPKGQSIEVLRRSALEEAQTLMTAPGDREHVTPYFYRNASRYRLVEFHHEPPCPDLQLSVDTAEDFLAFERLIAAMDRPHWQYDVAALIALASGTQKVAS